MWKKIWHFIWYEDSFASWIVNLVISFVLVKWVIYPGIGFLLSTSYPIVAVVSSSMEHNGQGFDQWWQFRGAWYEQRKLTKEAFSSYPFKNGFNKGDIMVLMGIKPKDIKVGTVVVYENPKFQNPIIHRVVTIEEENGNFAFTTKGDNNYDVDSEKVTAQHIQRTGRAVLRVPFLGWVKIWFVQLIGAVSIK